MSAQVNVSAGAGTDCRFCGFPVKPGDLVSVPAHVLCAAKFDIGKTPRGRGGSYNLLCSKCGQSDTASARRPLKRGGLLSVCISCEQAHRRVKPPKEGDNMPKILVSIPTDLLKVVNDIAKSKYKDRSEFIRDALRRRVEEMGGQAPEAGEPTRPPS